MNRFLLAECPDEDNGVWAWRDQLYCTILKNGSLSLRCKKYMHSDGAGWWPSRRGIKTPEQFMEAYSSIDEIDIGALDFEAEVLPNLRAKWPSFAVILTEYYRTQWRDRL